MGISVGVSGCIWRWINVILKAKSVIMIDLSQHFLSIAGLHIMDVRTDRLRPEFVGCYEDDGYTHDAQCVVYHGPHRRYHVSYEWWPLESGWWKYIWFTRTLPQECQSVCVFLFLPKACRHAKDRYACCVNKESFPVLGPQHLFQLQWRHAHHSGCDRPDLPTTDFQDWLHVRMLYTSGNVVAILVGNIVVSFIYRFPFAL